MEAPVVYPVVYSQSNPKFTPLESTRFRGGVVIPGVRVPSETPEKFESNLGELKPVECRELELLY